MFREMVDYYNSLEINKDRNYETTSWQAIKTVIYNLEKGKKGDWDEISTETKQEVKIKVNNAFATILIAKLIN